jgi:hypothetical protein
MARYAKFFSLGGSGGTSSNSLQLPSGTILDATLRQVQDGLGTGSPLYLSTGGLRVGTTAGSAMYWDNVNNRLGVGTTTPLGILHLKSTAATTRMVMDGDAGQNRLISYRTGAVQRFGLYVNNTAESGSNVGSDFAIRAYNDAGTLLSTPVFIKRSTGYVGINTTSPTNTTEIQIPSTYGAIGSNANLYLTSASTSAAIKIGISGSGAGCAIQATQSGGGTAFNLALNPFGGSVNVGNSNLGASLGIKGSGSTIATTSLLVQNSAGTELIKVADNGKVSLNIISNLDGTGIVKMPIYLQSEGSSFIFKNSGSSDLLSLSSSVANFLGTITFNNASPSASACVDLTSTTKGFLPPRMTTTQRDAIVTPATGLRIYNTTTNTNDTYNGTAWQSNSVSGVAGAIQFSNGSAFASDAANLFWDDTNNRLGVGTNVPLYGTQLQSDTSGPNTLIWSRAAGSLNTSGIIFSVADNTVSGNQYHKGGIFFKGDGAGAGRGSLILVSNTANDASVASSSNVGIALLSSGNNSIGTLLDLNARVGIRGSGSTSATTSLLVQNSAGTSKFFVDDSSVGADCCIGNLVNGYSSLQWNANAVGVGLISGGGLGAKVSNSASFVIQDSGTISNVTSAKLVVNSTNAGFLPPRMTTAEKNLIATPANGLIVYDTTLARPCFFNGATWITL